MITKEMSEKICEQIKNYSDQDLLSYNYTYSDLQKHYPNFYYLYALEKSKEEIERRGLKKL